ncbi:MAG TPA: DJ-1 family protein [Spirochaetia bacterium]|nr:MAG: hypothetical protein A2Y41_03080 [Spirochaetes bacterium GWB1_36_13]HCL56651.1 DJ-1 family protein [Spirochaetia bacterium]
MKTAVILFENLEEIEAFTQIDLLRRAGIQVDTYGYKNKKLTGSHKIVFESDFVFKKSSDIHPEDYHALILPGGKGVYDLVDEKPVLEVIQNFKFSEKIIFAICAAPLLLDKADVLDSKSYTCYPGTDLKMKNKLKEKSKTVKNGNIITAEGIGSAIEGALLLIEMLLGKNKKEEIAKQIVYY